MTEIRRPAIPDRSAGPSSPQASCDGHSARSSPTGPAFRALSFGSASDMLYGLVSSLDFILRGLPGVGLHGPGCKSLVHGVSLRGTGSQGAGSRGTGSRTSGYMGSDGADYVLKMGASDIAANRSVGMKFLGDTQDTASRWPSPPILAVGRQHAQVQKASGGEWRAGPSPTPSRPVRMLMA